MYPHAPRSHRPTNYWYILALCVVVMLGGLWIGLRQMSTHFNPSGASQAALLDQPSAAPKAKPTASVQPTATAVSASASASASAQPSAAGVVDVDPKTLTDSPATYRSRVIRVQGKIFYTGKLADGKTWIQIVGPNNVYVNGQMSDPLPAGISKGSQVQVTGIGAGLTNITASNGKDYDEAYIDPVQKVEPAQ